MPLPTTRRGRYLYRRAKYIRQMKRWNSWKWKSKHSVIPGPYRLYKKSWASTPHLQADQAVSQKSYDSQETEFGEASTPHAHSEVGYKKPPHITITFPPYVAEYAAGKHMKRALIGFHCRRVHRVGRVSTIKRTKLERMITGCNWFYFRQGCFSDSDVLGRHPNETDIANGAPLPSTFWPEPLGYT